MIETWTDPELYIGPGGAVLVLMVHFFVQGEKDEIRRQEDRADRAEMLASHERTVERIIDEQKEETKRCESRYQQVWDELQRVKNQIMKEVFNG